MKELKDIKTKAVKSPRTIKVSTVITSVVVALAIIGSFVAGWHFKSADSERVHAQAEAIVKSLDEK